MTVTISPNLKKESVRIDAGGRIIQSSSNTPKASEPIITPTSNEPELTIEEKLARLEAKIDKFLNSIQ